MPVYQSYSSLLKSPDSLIHRIEHMFAGIDSELSNFVLFRSKIQRDNLLNFLAEADRSLQKYEQIYPYIEEMCRDQIVDPAWYDKIEKVLRWALQKGRGNPGKLSGDVKDAWLTYIILLSCSMIDNFGSGNFNRQLILKTGNNSLLRLTGKN